MAIMAVMAERSDGGAAAWYLSNSAWLRRRKAMGLGAMPVPVPISAVVAVLLLSAMTCNMTQGHAFSIWLLSPGRTVVEPGEKKKASDYSLLFTPAPCILPSYCVLGASPTPEPPAHGIRDRSNMPSRSGYEKHTKAVVSKSLQEPGMLRQKQSIIGFVRNLHPTLAIF